MTLRIFSYIKLFHPNVNFSNDIFIFFVSFADAEKNEFIVAVPDFSTTGQLVQLKFCDAKIMTSPLPKYNFFFGPSFLLPQPDEPKQRTKGNNIWIFVESSMSETFTSTMYCVIGLLFESFSHKI